jgi:predicted DNA-binding transcriptional regulator AlpA
MNRDFKQIQVLQLSLEDLSTMMTEAVAKGIEKANNVIQLNPEPEKDKLMSRAETAALLGVSLTTLFHWNNDKTLPNQKIGGRVYYQYSVIMDKLNNVA